jgi:hypothetical protein
MLIIGSVASGGGKPGTPTIGTATAGNGSSTVTFTAPSYVGKGGTVTYTATSSPGSITGTSTTSPITVSGLTNGTAYTFTVKATTSYGVSSDNSAASNSITPAANYSLYQTFNASGTFTMPNTATQVAFFIVAAGGGGGIGGTPPRNVRNERWNGGGPGGGGGAAGISIATQDVPLTPGANYSVVIGARANGGTISTPYNGGAGGNSSFGNFVMVEGGTGGRSNWGTSGGGGGAGGYTNTPGFNYNLSQSYNIKMLQGAAGGNNGAAGSSATGDNLSLALGGSLGTVNYATSGGGGGGSGGYNGSSVYGPSGGGNAGTGGGAGGTGGNQPSSQNGNGGDGLAGASVNSPGGGGGGSGGPGAPYNINIGNVGSSQTAGYSGAGQLVIYVK